MRNLHAQFVLQLIRRAYTARGRVNSSGFLRHICSLRSAYLCGQCASHQSCVRFCIKLRAWRLIDASVSNSGGLSAVSPIYTVELIVSRASWSANSFPDIPSCPGIHLICDGAEICSISLRNFVILKVDDVVLPVCNALSAAELSIIM